MECCDVRFEKRCPYRTLTTYIPCDLFVGLLDDTTCPDEVTNFFFSLFCDVTTIILEGFNHLNRVDPGFPGHTSLMMF